MYTGVRVEAPSVRRAGAAIEPGFYRLWTDRVSATTVPSDGVQEVGLAVSDVGAVAESAEAESLFTLAWGVPDADREKFGIRATRLGGGVIVSTLQDPSGFWSKIIGLGVTEPVTDFRPLGDPAGRASDHGRGRRSGRRGDRGRLRDGSRSRPLRTTRGSDSPASSITSEARSPDATHPAAPSRLTPEELRARGHDVTVSGPWSQGRLSVVTRDPDSGILRAAANPRGAQGYAAGR